MSTAQATRQKITPAMLAREWGVSIDKIHCWIRAGELRAVNAALRADSQLPRYLIDRRDVEAFEAARAAVAAPPPAPRRRAVARPVRQLV